MKTILILIGLIISFSAHAEEPKVEITSFVIAGYRTHAAELCGKVTGSMAPFVIAKITVDPNSDKPGIYNVLVGSEGRFCAAVVTYDGNAYASVATLGRELRSSIATASDIAKR